MPHDQKMRGVPPRISKDKAFVVIRAVAASGDARLGLFPCASGRPDANQHPRWNLPDGYPQGSSS
jgi:hypothetical protein